MCSPVVVQSCAKKTEPDPAPVNVILSIVIELLNEFPVTNKQPLLFIVIPIATSVFVPPALFAQSGFPLESNAATKTSVVPVEPELFNVVLPK